MVQQETARREPCLTTSVDAADDSAECRDTPPHRLNRRSPAYTFRRDFSPYLARPDFSARGTLVRLNDHPFRTVLGRRRVLRFRRARHSALVAVRPGACGR